MPSSRERGAPIACAELEAWGGGFPIEQKDGRILQRNFGGHKYRDLRTGDRPAWK